MTGIKNVMCDLAIVLPPGGKKNSVYPPYGAMYVASALRDHGFSVRLFSAGHDDPEGKDVIRKIAETNPRYIGFSGIVAPSYGYIKSMSAKLRGIYPEKTQILGGGLSSAAGVVLDNTSIDIVVCGEGDVTIVELIKRLDAKSDIGCVRGIYHRNGRENVFSGPRPLIGDLDDLPYPAFDLVDMDNYLVDGIKFIRDFVPGAGGGKIDELKRKGRTRMITIMTSRGCFGRCSFCFRAYPGLRLNSMEYIFDYMDHCIRRFNVGFINFADECFASNKKRNWEFIEEFRRRRPDVMFRILGMRVDTVDRDILRAYKEIGCWMIEYGFESGCQKMLNIIDKNVTVKDNERAAKWTREAGIYTSPTLVLAMPGENNDTVRESIEFLKSLGLGYKQYQWSYALPIPGSALYEFARITKAIEDEDAFLSSLKGDIARAGIFHINLTDEPDDVVSTWGDRLRDELDDYYFRTRYGNPAIIGIMRIYKKLELYYRRGNLAEMIFLKLKGVFIREQRSMDNAEDAVSNGRVRFRRKACAGVDEILRIMGGEYERSGASLKKINKRMRDVCGDIAPKTFQGSDDE